MRIIEDIVSYGHGSLDPSYIVIHETANPGATARNHRDYWARDDTYAVHYVGDWTGVIYHCVPDDCLCWQVGNGNPYVVGIELCHATNQADFNAVWNLGVEWAAMMLKRYGWGIDRLISHNDCTNWWGGSDHTDPIGYFDDFGKSWSQFKSEVQAKMNTKEWPLILWPTNGANNQRFTLEKKGNYYLIRCKADKRVLDVEGNKLGGDVILYEAHGGTNQLWKLVKVDEMGMYEIETALKSGYVLDAKGNASEDGQGLCCYKRHGGVNQRWHLMNNGDGTYTIVSNMKRKLVLDCKGGGK